LEQIEFELDDGVNRAVDTVYIIAKDRLT